MRPSMRIKNDSLRGASKSSKLFHITMCLRVLRDALVSQVEYFRLRRSRATASERAMVRATKLSMIDK